LHFKLPVPAALFSGSEEHEKRKEAVAIAMKKTLDLYMTQFFLVV